MISSNQKHLGYNDTINYGGYYTSEKLVKLVFDIIRRNTKDISDFSILDTSCGYGSFLMYDNCIGADIDVNAISFAKKIKPSLRYYIHNSLENISRNQYNLSSNDKIIIIGNPPYNDTTSIVKNKIKQAKFNIDIDVKTRDLGISFLLSYNKLKADYICVLHPLSYLIKKANFELLTDFNKNYKLYDSIIVSSSEFSNTSKGTHFPIVIGFYKRDKYGMDYNFILSNKFKTVEGKVWSINQFDYITNYITKYPNKKTVSHDKTIAHFWTMRDINALKRTKTFITEESYNTIRVTSDKLAYYCYVDIFKEYIKKTPYYFGNSDIMIDYHEFENIKNIFISKSLKKYDFINKEVILEDPDIIDNIKIDNYFKNLLGEHYVD